MEMTGKLNGKVASILVTSYHDATRMLRGSYEEIGRLNLALRRRREQASVRCFCLSVCLLRRA